MGSPAYDVFLSNFTDYKSITTFWDDFSIAEGYGPEAVVDTFKRAFKSWKKDYKYLTELVMVLNHRASLYAGRVGKIYLARLYEKYFEQANDYAVTHLKGDQLRYYFQVTD